MVQSNNDLPLNYWAVGGMILWLILSIGAIAGGITLLVFHDKTKRLRSEVEAEEAAAKLAADANKATEKREGVTSPSCLINPWGTQCKIDNSLQLRVPDRSNEAQQPDTPTTYIENTGYLGGGITLIIMGVLSTWICLSTIPNVDYYESKK